MNCVPKRLDKNITSVLYYYMNSNIAQQIIDEYLLGANRSDLAEKYGISRSFLGNIIIGKRFEECKRPHNMQEILRQRYIESRGSGSGKISQEIAQSIILEYCQGASTYELADKYGLWQTSICNIISGRSWKKCQRPDNIKQLIQSRHEKGHFEKGAIRYIDAPPLTETQSEIIIGSLLGDGSIKCDHANCSFIKSQCKKYKNYVEWHNEILDPYSSKLHEVYSTDKLICNNGIISRIKVEKRLIGYRFYTHQHPVFTELRKKWYPDNKKIIPNDLALTPLSIAIWFCDDGHNSFSHREAIISTQSFTFEEADFLCQLLGGFEIYPSIMTKVSAKTGIKQPILKCNSQSYDNLINLIMPYITWECMAHKIKWRPAMKQWEYSSKFTESDILKIYELSRTHKQYEIAELFDVHKNTISSILRGESWQHLSHLSPYIPKSVRKSSH